MEIVPEVADVDAALKAFEQVGRRVVEPLRDRPWGLRDFRVIAPDGYYADHTRVVANGLRNASLKRRPACALRRPVRFRS